MNNINLLEDYEESFSSLNKSGIINGYECKYFNYFFLQGGPY